VKKLFDTRSPDSSDELPSRSELKRARRVREEALEQLASELSVLDDKKLQSLELPEGVLDAIDEVRHIKNLRARARQLRVVRTALRDASWIEIRAKLERIAIGGQLGSSSSPSPADLRAREWMMRLRAEGDKAIDEIVAARPGTDRKRLVRLMENTRRGSSERRKRAEAELIRALRSLVP
jgi:ribosome-associated protein